MRLTEKEIDIIRETAHEVFGQNIQITLFGSRVNDQAKGGDIDLMIEVYENVDRPALLSARVASRVSRSLAGRAVDVVLKAPNLKTQPIHEIAARSGIVL
ncbi:MAG: nucleotidyltransferase domain-containing protein [Burkholderiaceae bacterium]|nr:nucleotidyltransferase domain-containing protein [Burkholderiaceae bacterium]MCD8517881.1 nucleotidyltransferase domain-containing protein [Burkholderiaceae bacterium]MCD8538294.1 nucleotidyltransferase domain-containing protein [Burkholderiaceae bacterium]MCD8565377.1 nucleotidyltransferase domain-containing protein [Burkholderiaceae bacterium]